MTKRQVDDQTRPAEVQVGAALSLERALAATRKHFDGRPERALSTEDRILEHAWPTAPQRRLLLYLPLAALFVGSVAFAQELGALFDGARERFFGVAQPIEQRELAPRPSAGGHRETATRTEPTPAAGALDRAPASPQPASDRLSVPRSVLSAVSTAASASAAPAAQRRASSNAPPAPVEVTAVDEFALYREAHRAHFVDRDYASALAHWDRYLTAARHGSMAPEARYNRALALYHLGRRDEAAAALRHFADGAYGRYRRDEARRLLETLEAR